MLSSAGNAQVSALLEGWDGGVNRAKAHTFEESPAVDLAGGDLEGNDMALQREENESQHGLLLIDQGGGSRLSALSWRRERGCAYLGLVEQLDGYSDSARHDVLISVE